MMYGHGIFQYFCFCCCVWRRVEEWQGICLGTYQYESDVYNLGEWKDNMKHDHGILRLMFLYMKLLFSLLRRLYGPRFGHLLLPSNMIWLAAAVGLLSNGSVHSFCLFEPNWNRCGLDICCCFFILIIITTNHYESTLCSCVYFVVKGEKRCLLITKMWEGSHPITSQTDEAWPLGLDLDPAELPDIYWRHTS